MIEIAFLSVCNLIIGWGFGYLAHCRKCKRKGCCWPVKK